MVDPPSPPKNFEEEGKRREEEYNLIMASPLTRTYLFLCYYE
jgi:hypothetical protein